MWQDLEPIRGVTIILLRFGVEVAFLELDCSALSLICIWWATPFVNACALVCVCVCNPWNHRDPFGLYL